MRVDFFTSLWKIDARATEKQVSFFSWPKGLVTPQLRMNYVHFTYKMGLCVGLRGQIEQIFTDVSRMNQLKSRKKYA